MDFIEELQDRWTEEADELENRGLKREGAFLRSVTDDLREAESRWQEEPLTLEEAAVESGYTKEHLGRLVREGTIPNAGTKGSPLILRRHLPRKPGHGIEPAERASPTVSWEKQVARSIVNSDSGDGDG